MACLVRWIDGGGPMVDLADLDLDDPVRLADRPVLAGNCRVPLGELARVTHDSDDPGRVRFEGDLRRVAGLGTRLAAGRLEVRGDVGPRLGAGMTGGSIEVFGSVGPWAGAGMTGGLIRVHGDAGDYLGSARPGLKVGMREGAIVVDGSAGAEVGLGMRRGLIAVGGSTGPGLGRNLVAGSIFAFGPVGSGLGFGMRRGTIGLFHAGFDPDGGMLPTFHPSGSLRPHVLSIYLKHLRDELKFAVPQAAFAGAVRRYNGDLVAGGQGEILVVGTGQGAP